MNVDARCWVWTGTIWVRMAGTAGGQAIVAGDNTPADNVATPTDAIAVQSFGQLYDGATWDLWRGTSVAGAGNVAEQLAPGAEDNTNNIIASVPKPLAVSTYCASLFTQFATDPDVSVKASAGNVFSFYVHNLNAAARYFQLHNKATAPAGADVPLLTFLIPPQSAISFGEEFFGQTGVQFSTGIAYGFSTTEGTYTAGAAADQYAAIRYK